MPYLILSIVLATLIVLLVVSLFSSKIKSTDLIVSQNSNLSKPLQGALRMFGGDVYALIPDNQRYNRRRHHNREKLFITSGNPWKITQREFLVLQVLLMLGGILATIMSILLFSNLFPWPVMLGLGALISFLGWYYPISVYKARAQARISAFKTDLPEAIDFLVIALSGGSTGLPAGIERTLKYLPDDSIMKDEYKEIIEDLNSGKSIYEALDSFAKRAPTESIQAFVKALNSANKMSTPLEGLLRERSKASRLDLNAEIDRKITTLPTKVMLVLGPVAYISIILIAMAPAAASLIGML